MNDELEPRRFDANSQEAQPNISPNRWNSQRWLLPFSIYGMGTLTGIFTIATIELLPRDGSAAAISAAAASLSAVAAGLLIWENARGINQIQRSLDQAITVINRFRGQRR